MPGANSIVGILLGAGRATRFGSAKLLSLFPGGDIPGECIGAASARNLLAAIPEVVAVVRSDDGPLAAALGASGARIVRFTNADEGMGASLACAVRATPNAAGWVVALADMPWILPSTIARIAEALRDGAPLAAPFHEGQRGHPVGFARACHDALAALSGDEGAKSIVAANRDRIVRIDVDDPGILRDVDTPADLG
jgi:molybdenum cofactor cytidylyltransferase